VTFLESRVKAGQRLEHNPDRCGADQDAACPGCAADAAPASLDLLTLLLFRGGSDHFDSLAGTLQRHGWTRPEIVRGVEALRLARVLGQRRAYLSVRRGAA
jgi:hypothetical protein